MKASATIPCVGCQKDHKWSANREPAGERYQPIGDLVSSNNSLVSAMDEKCTECDVFVSYNCFYFDLAHFNTSFGLGRSEQSGEKAHFYTSFVLCRFVQSFNKSFVLGGSVQSFNKSFVLGGSVQSFNTSFDLGRSEQSFNTSFALGRSEQSFNKTFVLVRYKRSGANKIAHLNTTFSMSFVLGRSEWSGAKKTSHVITGFSLSESDQSQAKKKNRVVVIAVVSLCGLLIFFLAFFLFIFSQKKNPNDEIKEQIAKEGLTETLDSCSPRPFTFEELSQATNNFHQDRMLGLGGFGGVYKAVFPNGKNAAVKRVSNTSQQGIKEYKAEVTIVSRSNHRNLVQLMGWCHEIKGELLLVYELMENKSMDIHLFKSEMATLAWNVRYKIAQGLAKALRYLHEECSQHCVLHMDIKSSNVLLDSNFEPKLGDFGLAKLVDHERSMQVSVLAGTRGYLAPECVLTGRVSWHSDVYSYGVVALELATGRKTIDPNAEEDQKLLVTWVQNLYKTGKILEAVDPKLGDDYDELQMKVLIIVGLWCVHHDFHERPSMSEIVHVLNNTQDPLSDLQQKIPTLVPDAITHHTFESILQTRISTSDMIISLETQTPSPRNLMPPSSDDKVVPKPLIQTSHLPFVWPRIPVLGRLWYLLGITWFRSFSHYR